MFVTFAVTWIGYPSKRVGAVINKGRSSMSRWVSEGLTLQKSVSEFRDYLNRMTLRFAKKWPGADLLLLSELKLPEYLWELLGTWHRNFLRRTRPARCVT